MSYTSDIYTANAFAGKTVLVTGAASGIGEAICSGFLQHGANVIGTVSSEGKRASLEAQGVSARVCDVRSDEDVQKLIGGLNSLDVLITAAGIARRIKEYEWQVFRDVMEVNLFGTARFALQARPLLSASNGSIVTVASMLSTFGDKLVPAYAASKGGVSQLTKSLAIEYAPDGIRVNAIAPGWIRTSMTQSLVDDPEAGPVIAARAAMNRWGEPGEVAAGAMFLASPAASFMTGSTLTIDGGYSIT